MTKEATSPRSARHLAEAALVAAAGLILAAYLRVPALRSRVDVFVTPAVEGLTVGYSSLSTIIYRKTGIDLGLVSPQPDPEFDERVRIATYINERNAGPLIEIATDKRFSDAKRESALQALLKFNATADWIQPLLNELPKGGMAGLYQRNTPTLDALFRRVREEGGVQQPLVRAYADLVFSFMLQVPDAMLRAHAFNWLSDALPEDALSMIISRIPDEKDGDVRRAIEQALLDVRVVPKPAAAAGGLLPIYRNPPWETLKAPVAVVMARVGDRQALDWLKNALKMNSLSEEERAGLDLAVAGTRYPEKIDTTAVDEQLALRQKQRREQEQAAVIKRDRLERQEKIQQDLLAKASAPDKAAYPAGEANVELPYVVASRPMSMTLPVNRPFVVSSDAALYSSPGEGRLQASLPAGTEVKAEFQATAKGHTWYQVSTAQGPRWVDGNELDTPEQARFLSQAEDENAVLEVADGAVPVYASATAASRVVASLGKGHVVHVLRADKVTAEQWFEVQLDQGTSGWIRGDLSLRLKVTPPAGKPAP